MSFAIRKPSDNSAYCGYLKARYYGAVFACGDCRMSETNADAKPDTEIIHLLNQQLYLHMRSFGYALVDLPLIEPADLFLIKAGDQIVDKLFTFEHRGAQLALRPEFTASAAYYYINTYKEHYPVARWQFSGYTFNDDPFSLENNKQQFSIGAEMIGMGGMFADAEIIGMAVSGLAKQNISNCQITLGHVGLLRRVLAHFGLDNRVEHFLLSHLHDLKNPSRGREHVIE
ncbi:MAG: ATP phosphoribosyltransferase regulatory subunit, partial [Taibaiella sp.]|nr:ATP phosphoribosyltransferase regulatory subunit [Taibaiella sp.]